MKLIDLSNKIMGITPEKEVFKKNIIQSNIFVGKMFIAYIVVDVLNIVLNILQYNSEIDIDNSYRNAIIYGVVAFGLLFIPAIIDLVKKGKGTYLHYLLVVSMLVATFFMTKSFLIDINIILIFPIIIICRYYSPKLTFFTTIFSIIFFLLNVLKFVLDYVTQAPYEFLPFIKNMSINQMPVLIAIIICGIACILISKKCHEMVVEQDIISTKNASVKTELELASKIQLDMLPREFPAFPNRKEFDIYASMVPAKEVGGDFYDYYLIDNDHLVLTIADVSDKGVPSALFMSMSRTILKLNAENYHSPKEIMEYSNNLLCDESKDRMFVTAWLGIYEISTGTLTCVNAGHEYPIIKRNNGEYEVFKDKHSFVLGGLKNVPFKEYTLKLNVGDELFLYTDGVAEATSEDDELFGLDRTVDTLNKYKNCNQNDLHKNIEQTLLNFTGNNNQFDDITMVSFKVNSILSK